ncbi:hypothetical protein RHSIM_Rhsim07G0156200 [Rhododendron simsii]|uniref:Uncharacterized protein n=1 Tax=Rhododendron simsii TaxID=118357 RepID=A0A834LJY1_RHOSS|nr:hypothetical protein RHSIM_Rhsim07G0156200 [Rhododendron simsii]
MIFCKGEIPSIKHIRNALSEFEALSGLSASPGKSSIFFSGVNGRVKETILQELGFQEGSLPVSDEVGFEGVEAQHQQNLGFSSVHSWTVSYKFEVTRRKGFSLFQTTVFSSADFIFNHGESVQREKGVETSTGNLTDLVSKSALEFQDLILRYQLNPELLACGSFLRQKVSPVTLTQLRRSCSNCIWRRAAAHRKWWGPVQIWWILQRIVRNPRRFSGGTKQPRVTCYGEIRVWFLPDLPLAGSNLDHSRFEYMLWYFTRRTRPVLAEGPATGVHGLPTLGSRFNLDAPAFGSALLLKGLGRSSYTTQAVELPNFGAKILLRLFASTAVVVQRHVAVAFERQQVDGSLSILS